MTQVPTIDDAAYHEIEEAISSTVRGRAYLRMRDRRAGLLATDTLHRLSAEMKDVLDRRLAGSQAQGDLDGMRRELQELRAHIERSRAAISRIAVKEGDAGGGQRIVKATEELYEIVASTERATSDILGAAEAIQERLGGLDLKPEDRQAIEDRCMEIFMACGFQDITGQRIAKVVSTMAYVEQRVASMVAMWGEEASAEGSVRTGRAGDDAEPAGDADAHLLNGPQMPGLGLGQDAVDALFGGHERAPAAPVASAASGASELSSPSAAPDAAVPAAAPAAPPPKAATPKPAPPVPKLAPAPAKAAAKPKPAAAASSPAPPPPAAATAPASKLDQSAVDALFA